MIYLAIKAINAGKIGGNDCGEDGRSGVMELVRFVLADNHSTDKTNK
jgi:hypothetical protein